MYPVFFLFIKMGLIFMNNNQLKIITIVGASGLVGQQLLNMLLDDITVHKVILLSRTAPETQHRKIHYIATDFSKMKNYVEEIRGSDVLYCCIGTTIKKAKSKEAFRMVDFQIPVDLARIAEKAGIPKFIVISSLGADATSSNFYLKTKGEMEAEIFKNYRFQKLAFVRPSMLMGSRHEFRLGERLAQFFMMMFSFLMVGKLKKYRPIHDFKVAKAMIGIANSMNNKVYYESSDLEWLST